MDTARKTLRYCEIRVSRNRKIVRFCRAMDTFCILIATITVGFLVYNIIKCLIGRV